MGNLPRIWVRTEGSRFRCLPDWFVTRIAIVELQDAITKRLKNQFSKPLTEIYLIAVHSFTSILTRTNTHLQTNVGLPLIHRLHTICDDLVRSCLRRYCQSEPEDLEDTDKVTRLVISICYKSSLLAIHSIFRILGTLLNNYILFICIQEVLQMSYLPRSTSWDGVGLLISSQQGRRRPFTRIFPYTWKLSPTIYSAT